MTLLTVMMFHTIIILHTINMQWCGGGHTERVRRGTLINLSEAERGGQYSALGTLRLALLTSVASLLPPTTSARPWGSETVVAYHLLAFKSTAQGRRRKRKERREGVKGT